MHGQNHIKFELTLFRFLTSAVPICDVRYMTY